MANELQNPSNPKTKNAATSKSSDRLMDFAVFFDTSLGHNFVMLVSDSDTVRDLKRKILLEYADGFPEVGEINVLAIKINLRGTLYRLSESMLVGKAFEATIGARSLHVDVSPIAEPKHNETRVSEDILITCKGHGDRNPIILGNKNNGSHLLQSLPDIPCHPNRDGNSVGMNLDQNVDRVSDSPKKKPKGTKSIIGIPESSLSELGKGIDVVRVQMEVDDSHVLLKNGALAVHGQIGSIEQGKDSRKRKDREQQSDLKNDNQSEVVSSSPKKKRHKRKKEKASVEAKSDIDKPQVVCEKKSDKKSVENVLGCANDPVVRENNLELMPPNIPKERKKKKKKSSQTIPVVASPSSHANNKDKCDSETGLAHLSANKTGDNLEVVEENVEKSLAHKNGDPEIPMKNSANSIFVSSPETINALVAAEKVIEKICRKSLTPTAESPCEKEQVALIAEESTQDVMNENITELVLKSPPDAKTQPGDPEIPDFRTHAFLPQQVPGHPEGLGQAGLQEDVDPRIPSKAVSIVPFGHNNKSERRKKKKKKKNGDNVEAKNGNFANLNISPEKSTEARPANVDRNPQRIKKKTKKDSSQKRLNSNVTTANMDSLVVATEGGLEQTLNYDFDLSEHDVGKGTFQKVADPGISSEAKGNRMPMCGMKDAAMVSTVNANTDETIAFHTLVSPCNSEHEIPSIADDGSSPLLRNVEKLQKFDEQPDKDGRIPLPEEAPLSDTIKDPKPVVAEVNFADFVLLEVAKEESSQDVMNENITELVLKSPPDAKTQPGDPEIPDFRTHTFLPQQVPGHPEGLGQVGLQEDDDPRIPSKAVSIVPFGHNNKSERHKKKKKDKNSDNVEAKNGNLANLNISPEKSTEARPSNVDRNPRRIKKKTKKDSSQKRLNSNVTTANMDSLVVATEGSLEQTLNYNFDLSEHDVGKGTFQKVSDPGISSEAKGNRMPLCGTKDAAMVSIVNANTDETIASHTLVSPCNSEHEIPSIADDGSSPLLRNVEKLQKFDEQPDKDGKITLPEEAPLSGTLKDPKPVVAEVNFAEFFLPEVTNEGSTASPEDVRNKKPETKDGHMQKSNHRELQEESTTRKELIGGEAEIKKMRKKAKSNRDVEKSNVSMQEAVPCTNEVHISCDLAHTNKETTLTGIQTRKSHAENYDKKTQVGVVLSDLESQELLDNKSHKIKGKTSLVNKKPDGTMNLKLKANRAKIPRKSNANVADDSADACKKNNASPFAFDSNTEGRNEHYRLAVRKVPGGKLEKLDSSKTEKTSLVGSLSIFDHISDDISEDEHAISKRQIDFSSSSSDADMSDTQAMHVHCSQASMVSHGTRKSERIRGNNKEIPRNVTTGSQASGQKMKLGAILRNSSSYKKAKLVASQTPSEEI